MTFLADFLPSPSGFRDPDDIQDYVVHSKNFDSSREDPEDANVLLLFHTSKQKTWLVATKERVYCILDDIRKSEPHINWSVTRNRIVDDEAVVWRIDKSDKNSKTGILNFENAKSSWYYSKDLFIGKDVVDEIENFVCGSFACHKTPASSSS